MRDASGDQDGDTFALDYVASGPGTINLALQNLGHIPSAGSCGADGNDSLGMICQWGIGSWSNVHGDWNTGFVLYRSLTNTVRARAYAKLDAGASLYESDVLVSGSSTVDFGGLAIPFSFSRCSGSDGPATFDMTATFP